MTFTHGQLAACAQRELRVRQKVYRKWVREGKYTAEHAMREIALMEAIMQHFVRLAELDSPSLFSESKLG